MMIFLLIFTLMKKLFTFILLFSFARINAQIITTVAGNGTIGYSGDGGQATAAGLYSPTSVALDKAGNIYIADNENMRLRKIDSSGIITTIAGDGTGSFSGDGSQAVNAQLKNPYGVAIDLAGNIYIADVFNYRIRKIDTTGIITTVAGNGVGGFSGDSAIATAAQLGTPYGVAVDTNGNIYIADFCNMRIRKVNTSGIITTVAGNGNQGSNGDGGQAIAAELNSPIGITIDLVGNLFIAEYNGHRIRKVDVSGVITTVAGNGTQGFSGDGMLATSAELFNPGGIALDATGNIYIADNGNHRVRLVNLSGIISTFAGGGNGLGDGGISTNAQLLSPHGVTFDAFDNMYLADKSSMRIRKITNVGTTNVNELNDKNSKLNAYPNPSKDILTIESKIKNAEYKITDMLGNTVKQISSSTEKTTVDVSALQNGVYFIFVKDLQQKAIATQKIIVQH